jgi:hypothetical protein
MLHVNLLFAVEIVPKLCNFPGSTTEGNVYGNIFIIYIEIKVTLGAQFSFYR